MLPVIATTDSAPVLSKACVLQIPRFPVLGWQTFGGSLYTAAGAITDGRQSVYTASGQSAIALALETLEIRAGDRVLVPTYHCHTMVAPLEHVGAEPVFYPITCEGAPDLEQLPETSLTGVRAMLSVHYFGVVRSMGPERRFCSERGIALIEDCAHAYFGEAEGVPVGSWGDVAIASLTKFFPVPEGGCLVAGRKALKFARPPSRPPTAELKALWDCIEAGTAYGHFTGLNAPLRMLVRLKEHLREHRAGVGRGRGDGAEPGTLEAARARQRGYGNANVPGAAAPTAATRVTRWIARHAHRSRIVENRRRNYALYDQLLKGLPGVRALYPVLPAHAVPYVFPLRVDDPDPLYSALRSASAPVARWDYVWPGTPSLVHDCGAVWARQVLQLGCHQDMSESDVRAVAAMIRYSSESLQQRTR